MRGRAAAPSRGLTPLARAVPELAVPVLAVLVLAVLVSAVLVSAVLVSPAPASAVPVSAGERAAAPARPAAPAEAGAGGPVVVVGVAGLRWDDVSPATMPALWRLAERGSVGTLSVRAAQPRTCPDDGWLTLGAGNRARGPSRSGRCMPIPDAWVAAGRVTVWPEILEVNRRLLFGTRVGVLGSTLAASGACVTAVGAGAALAGADDGGRVPGSAAASLIELPPQTRQLGRPGVPLISDADQRHLRRCPVLMIAADQLATAGRTAAARRSVDQAIAAAVELAGRRGTALVVGVSELGVERPRLHVAVAAGPGFRAGELRSASTRRAPYVQLIDVAPTVLARLGLDAPPAAVGQPWRSVPGDRRASLAAEVTRLVDLDLAAQEQRRMVPAFFALLVGAQALLYLLAFVALLRLERGRRRDRVLDATTVAALAFAAAPAATYLAQLVPWWRAEHPLPVLLAAVGAADLAIVALALVGPWRRRALGPAGAVAGVTVAVLGVDVLTGARLQMSALAGYSPLVAGRFAGFGNVAYAVFATAALLLAAALAAGRSRRATVVIVAIVGTLAVVLDGSPMWGSDFGGVIALVPAFWVLGLLLTDARLSWRRVLVATAAGVVVVAGFALADYARPPDARTHVGRFVGQLLDGSAGTIVRRKAEANLHLLTTSVLTLLVPVAVAFLAAVLLRPTSGLRRAFDREPALRAGLLAVLVLGVVGFLVNDSGVAIPALAMSVAIPVAIAVSLSARDRPEPEAAPHPHAAPAGTARVDPGG